MHFTDFGGFPFESDHGGNLEFRFSGPNSIPNSVQQYNVLRGAELAELRRRRERPISAPIFCKVRCPGSDVVSMVKSRDLDVVTQLSLDADTQTANEADEADEGDEGDEGSEHDMALAQRLCGGTNSPPPAEKGQEKAKPKARKVKNPSKNSKNQPRHLRRYPDPDPSGDFLEKLKSLHLEVCEELRALVEEERGQKPSPPASPKAKPKKAPRERRPKRQEGGSQKKAPHQEVVSSSKHSYHQVSYEDYYQPQPNWVDIMPSAMVSQGIKVNVCSCPTATPESACKFMEQYCSLEPESLKPFFQVDSDLDHEFAARKAYLRYVESRPRIGDGDGDDEEFTDDNGALECRDQAGLDNLMGQPCFVELERRPHQVSLLRSLSPMRYTSQGSELAQRPAPAPAPSRVLQQQEEKVPPLELNERKRRPRKPKAGGRQVSSKTNASTNNNKEVVRSLWDPVRVDSQPDLESPSPSIKDLPPTPPPPPKRHTKRSKGSPLQVVYSKSLEDLKCEKQRIYNKITFTQERIICSLDKLQMSLLQLPPLRPCSPQERQKRKRNAFDFCVRFARNFLYPLKGMIDDVRLTSVASFNSAISNEACHRVMCVFGLMLQSIQTYQRQLRYFLLEKVAQKLSALIEMIYTMINCCLDKGILSRNDPVVESLLERCTRFLSFIEEMQEERLKLARETQRRKHNQPLAGQGQGQSSPSHSRGRNKPPSPSPRHSHSPRPMPAHLAAPPVQSRPLRHIKLEKMRTHQRYDLKMYLNARKVYEPRVVAKEQPRVLDKMPRRRRRNHVNSIPLLAGNQIVDQPSDAEMQAMEEVETQMQIQGIQGDISSSSMSQSTIHVEGPGQWTPSPEASSPRRHEAMLDAMRRVTRSQLQEVLDPMMRSLSAMLNAKIAKMATK